MFLYVQVTSVSGHQPFGGMWQGGGDSDLFLALPTCSQRLPTMLCSSEHLHSLYQVLHYQVQLRGGR